MTPDRRKTPKLDPLGNTARAFVYRLMIYIVVIIIFVAIATWMR
jgi:hypothetical protein